MNEGAGVQFQNLLLPPFFPSGFDPESLPVHAVPEPLWSSQARLVAGRHVGAGQASLEIIRFHWLQLVLPWG